MNFCEKCGNLLRKISGEWVEVNGKLFFKCACGHLNDISKNKKPHLKSLKPLASDD